VPDQRSAHPVVPPGIEMVRAGPDAGVSPRSLGMLQENSPTGPGLLGNHFPARSFFDVFVKSLCLP